MEALIIPNGLPASTTALSVETLEERDSLVARIKIYGEIKDPETFTTVDGLLKRVIALEKFIEGERQRLKAPLLAAVRAFDDTFANAACDLVVERTRTGPLVVAWTEAENKRLADEHDRQVEAARIAKQEAEAKQRAAAEAARAAEPATINDEAPPWETQAAEPITHVPTVLPPAKFVPIKSAAVKVTNTKVLTITDASKIPRTVELLGQTITLMVPDEKAIVGLWKNGAAVPGTTYEPKSTIGAKG
jgi:hypothetical protein